MAIRDTYAKTQLPTSVASIPFPDFKSLVNTMLKFGLEAYICDMEGTGALLDSPALPFDPAGVLVFNETDQSVHANFAGFGAAKMMSIKAAAAWVATDGITLGTKKFTLGVNADLNAAADVLHCVAFGQRGIGGSL